eukprot:703825-Amphidinium_carterae.2
MFALTALPHQSDPTAHCLKGYLRPGCAGCLRDLPPHYICWHSTCSLRFIHHSFANPIGHSPRLLDGISDC